MKIRNGILTLTAASALAAIPAYAQEPLSERSNTQQELGQPALPETVEDQQQAMGNADEAAEMERAGEQISPDTGEEQQAMAGQEQYGQQDQQAAGQQDQQQAQAGQLPPPVSSQMIEAVQQALQDQGYDVSTDGIWGPNTHQALQQFQQEQGLDDNGQINMQTLSALDVQQMQAAADQSQAQQQAMAGQDPDQALGAEPQAVEEDRVPSLDQGQQGGTEAGQETQQQAAAGE